MAMESSATTMASKPRLRGVIHFFAAIAALPAAIALLLHARSGSVLGAVAYSVGMLLLFSASATYHKPAWSPRMRMVFRRVDRSMIYIFIAGSYTPFCLELGGSAADLLLPAVWVVALLGMIKSIVWTQLPRVVTAIPYVLLGWAAVPYALDFHDAMGGMVSGLIGVGGFFYTVGAVAYARKWPDPAPATFGYHEVFHVLVVAAVACHYTAVWTIVA